MSHMNKLEILDLCNENNQESTAVPMEQGVKRARDEVRALEPAPPAKVTRTPASASPSSPASSAMTCQDLIALLTGPTYLPRSDHWVFVKKVRGRYAFLSMPYSLCHVRDAYPSPTWLLKECPVSASQRFYNVTQWESRLIVKTADDIACFFDTCLGVYKGDDFIPFAETQ